MIGFAYPGAWSLCPSVAVAARSSSRVDAKGTGRRRRGATAPLITLQESSSIPSSDSGESHADIPSVLPMRPRKTQEQLKAELRAISERRERMRKQAMKALDDLRSQLDELLQEVRAKMRPEEGKAASGQEAVRAQVGRKVAVSDAELFVEPEQDTTGWYQLPRTGLNDAGDDYANSVTYTAASTPNLDEMGQQLQGDEYSAPAMELPIQKSEPAQMIVECDINGCCSLIVRDGDHSAPRGVRPQYVFSGPGFKIGHDPAAPPSDCALVGDDHWTIALSREEFRHFRRLVQALQYKMGDIMNGVASKPTAQGVPVHSGDGFCKERISWNASDGESSRIVAEFESSLMWLGASGSPYSYDLRLILLGRERIVEGLWPAQVVPSLCAKLMELEEPEALM
ncbi:hypothetical protein, conserved [Cyanidioschyzon merolae strain 10D]|jgi:ElaB/YqjD/DUF883 family membrane-anchored ribosome-binding protein|uniref:Uncharacterized protein n=1 Tax=Cyanidioschyzon merolae (strain NIES-3377 / 10D) TaxID=280699 RepID=M1V5V2_CYAM1|nr:hypothetical protein, conserved [Cyanidioschyzon merolae strain 10D]BAM81315.1 hypothetical protein, conserved [Cyanidioschyzon merolae strain 10D]|eukprot:XP_005537351.1 hypothetical protein, conserved [Cyanidioschyzon merolae strain 10D]